VTTLLLPAVDIASLALANPFAPVDQELAGWFHSHVSHLLVTVLSAFTELGSGEWIGIALSLAILFLLWQRSWTAVATLVVAVPGGMLLNELLKLAVHRQRPFFVDPLGSWSGYSFASGHTIGATLLYGQLALLVVPMLKNRSSRGLTIGVTTLLILLVGFSRIALGAHYLSDVLGGIVLGLLWLLICLFISRSIRRNPADLAAVPVEDL
jgi:membrane-associated phospholipid phosphatase